MNAHRRLSARNHTRRPRYHRHRFPPEIISHAVWLYHRYCMSFRDVEDLLAERGIIVSYETVRQWCGKFGPDYARQLKRRQGRLGDTWFLDEVFVTINVNGNRKPHICGNRKLHTSGEDVSGGADMLPVMPVGRVGLDAGSGATGVLANTRREAAEPAVTWRLPHAVRPTLSSASADAPASGSCCPGC